MKALTGVDGRRRVVIEAVSPEVDAGRFPAKRAIGETVTVEADVFASVHGEAVLVSRFNATMSVLDLACGDNPYRHSVIAGP